MAFKVTTATKKLLALKKRIRAVCGGTSASKTISIIMILIDYAQSNAHKKIHIMSESYPHLEDGAIDDFKNIMKDRGYWKDDRWNITKHSYTFETGSVIKFISIDKLGKAHGPRRDVLFLTEANNISYAIFDQLKVRTREVIWLDWNPITEFWYDTEIAGKVDHDFVRLTYKDNEALEQSVIDDIESHKDNKNWWTVYGLGLQGELEERIYKGWNIVDDIPKDARLVGYGLDFGFTNDPTVIIAIWYCDGRYYLDEVIYQKGLSNKSIADIFKAKEKAPVLADEAEPKSIQEIKDYGTNIARAMKGAGSVNQGIQYVQTLPISVTKRSVKTIKAYRNYMFFKDKNGKVTNDPDDSVHEWSNPMDAIRYGFGKRMKKKKSAGGKVDQM